MKSAGALLSLSLISTIGSVALFVLYRRKSPHAASFLFWTTVPIYPLYSALRLSDCSGRGLSP